MTHVEKVGVTKLRAIIRWQANCDRSTTQEVIKYLKRVREARRLGIQATVSDGRNGLKLSKRYRHFIATGTDSYK